MTEIVDRNPESMPTDRARRPMKVINIVSLSYTGTTWLNLVLGSHRRAFALGPPDRAWRLRESEFEGACLLHGPSCPFWTEFARRCDPEGNFLVELAAAAGVDAVVINNPTSAFREAVLQHPEIDEVTIRLVRDGRAVAASYARKFPDVGVVGAVGDSLHQALREFAFDPDGTMTLDLRYEDIQADPTGALAMIGAFVGIDYDASALSFWRWDHHVTTANVGPLALLKHYQGKAFGDIGGRAFYEQAFARLRENPMCAFGDDRWRDELTRRDLFLFDLVCGADNRRLGYPRDGFDIDETLAFVREFAEMRAAGALPPSLTAPVERLLRAFSSGQECAE